MFAGPYPCKDYVHDAVCVHLYPQYAQLWGIYRPDPFSPENPPNLSAPEFVLFCDVKRAERNAEKFQGIINQLESRMGLDERTTTIIPECGKSDKCGPFIARAPGFWLRSPIGVSAYCTFLRLAIRMQKGEALDDFIARTLDKAQSPCKDAGYIRVAARDGNLGGLMERRLPCFQREGYSDYLLSSHSRGLAWYHAPSDEVLPRDEASLKTLRIEGRKFEVEKYQYDV
jgi:hypothetical protein